MRFKKARILMLSMMITACKSSRNEAILSEIPQYQGLMQVCDLDGKIALNIYYFDYFLAYEAINQGLGFDGLMIIRADGSLILKTDFSEGKYLLTPAMNGTIEGIRTIRDFWTEQTDKDSSLAKWLKDFIVDTDPSSPLINKLMDHRFVFSFDRKADRLSVSAKSGLLPTTEKIYLPRKGENIFKNPVPVSLVYEATGEAEVVSTSWLEGGIFPKSLALPRLDLTCSKPKTVSTEEFPAIPSDEINRLDERSEQAALQAQYVLSALSMAVNYFTQLSKAKGSFSKNEAMTGLRLACSPLIMRTRIGKNYSRETLKILLEKYTTFDESIKTYYENIFRFINKNHPTQGEADKMLWNSCYDLNFPAFIEK